MTIDNVQNITPRVQYTATAGQKVYPYPFPIFENADLVVAINGVATGAFNATGAGNDTGGNVTLTTPSTLNDIVTIYRAIPIQRSTNFQQNGPLTSASFNDELDRIVAIEQQLAAGLAQALQVPITNIGAVPVLTAATYAGKYLAFDANGNPVPAALTTSGSLTGAIILALLTADGLGNALYPQTLGTGSEAAAGVTPVSHQYAPYTSFRYMTAAQIADVLTGTMALDCTAALTTCLGFANPVIMPGTYKVTAISLATTGSNKTITFAPGVQILSSQSTAVNPVMQFLNVADQVTVAGNGVRIGYIAAPAVRINHCVFFNGAAITNLDISGLNVINSGNFGIYVSCGLNNTLAAGSQRITIHDCKVTNSLGDGVHVDNADADVRIFNIDMVNIADDGVAVLSYTVTATTPSWHLTPTVGVSVTNINMVGSLTAVVHYGGVTNGVIDNINAYNCVSGFGISFTNGPGYNLGNTSCVVDNFTSTGTLSKGIVFDTPGAVTPANGTQYNTFMHVGKIVVNTFSANAISMSNSGTSAGGQISNITIDSIDAVGTGASAQSIYVGNTLNVRINQANITGTSSACIIANNKNFSWGFWRFAGSPASTATCVSVTGNTNIRAGGLDMDATNCTTGLIFQSNASVTHEGTWAVSGAGTANFSFGANTLVKGFFDQVGEYKTIGAVTAASTLTITYPRAAPTGAGIIPSISVASNEGLRWGVKNIVAASMTMLWTDAMTTVYVLYNIGMQAA